MHIRPVSTILLLFLLPSILLVTAASSDEEQSLEGTHLTVVVAHV